MEAFSDDRADRAAARSTSTRCWTTCARSPQNGFARHVAVRRGLRPVAAAGAWQPRPAGPGLPEPGEERRRGGARRRAARSCWPPPTGTACGSPVPGSGRGVHLPLMVSVRDNGPGIPEDLEPHLFDPFVTTKRERHRPRSCTGRQDRSATMAASIEFDSQPRRTVFRVLLPMSCRRRAAGAQDGSG